MRAHLFYLLSRPGHSVARDGMMRMPRSLLRRAAPVLLASLLAAGLTRAQGEVKTHWLRQLYAPLGGVETLLYSEGFRYSKIAFGDLNGDGQAEMLVGTEDGRVARFDNAGTADAPIWRLVEESLTVSQGDRSGQARTGRPLRVSGSAAPTLVDLDGDGDLDLLVGSGDGRVALFRNAGTPFLPNFELANPDFVPKGLGTNLVPFADDLNGDRAPDLLIGTAAGEVYLLMNSGTRRDPSFCARLPSSSAEPEDEPPCRPEPRLVASIKPDIFAAPALADWSGDGKPDLFIGQADGTIAYYENKGTKSEPQWTLTQRKFLAIDEGGYAAPAFFPTPRGRPDLYVGSSTNNVSLYTNRDTAAKLDAWRATGNALRIGRLGRDQERLTLTAGDVDGDGDLDLIIGDRTGAVWWVENVGNAKTPAWRIRQQPLVPESARGYSAPLLVDIDGDGDLDLLVGGGDGKLWLLRNKGTPKLPDWVMETTNFAGIDVGNGSIPAANDIDGDGDLDLFVGNSRGLVIFFRNEGSAKEPDYKLASTRFGEISVGQSAAPAFVDLNEDKFPDLVIGNREGRLTLLVNENEGDPQPRKWKAQSLTWEGIQVRGYSVPLFADFNGDGKPDLIVADGQGNLRLYLNGGIEKPPESAPAPAAVENKIQFPSPVAPGSAQGGTRGAGPSVAGRSAGGASPPGGATAAGPAVAGQGTPGANGPSADSTGPTDLNEANPAPGAEAGPPPNYQLVSEKYAGVQVEGRSVPAFGDLDGDGDLDLLVGTGKGQVLLIRNTGTKQEAKWSAEGVLPLDPPVGHNASIVLVDLDGDGLLDLLAGSEDGNVALYRNAGTKEQFKFVLKPLALSNINVGRNAAPSVMPLGQDPAGRLVIGSFGGNLLLYVRKGGARSLNFKLEDRQFLGRSFGVLAAPFAADMDHDGALDLIVGSDTGAVAHFAESTNAKAKWTQRTDFFKDLKFPPGATPRLADIDGDGNLDLFVGSEQGTIRFYANQAGGAESGSGN
jgi:hypothetical protein